MLLSSRVNLDGFEILFAYSNIMNLYLKEEKKEIKSYSFQLLFFKILVYIYIFTDIIKKKYQINCFSEYIINKLKANIYYKVNRGDNFFFFKQVNHYFHEICLFSFFFIFIFVIGLEKQH